MAANLISTKVQEIQFTNKITQSGQVQLESGFTLNVNYAADGTKCVARLIQTVREKSDPEQFSLKVDMIGAFNCVANTDEDKRNVHGEAYDALFPYMQSMVQQLCTSSGIPGFMLKKAVIDTNRVSVNNGAPQPIIPQDEPQLPIV